MSRIQQILDKAERDGYSRRIRSVDSGSASGGPLHGSTADFPGDDIGIVSTSSSPLTAARLVVGATLAPALITSQSEDAVAVEQYRALRTRLQADNAMHARAILVTSPGSGEGKTLTAGNLALTMAQEQRRRICLVDADLRTPGVQQIFGLPDGPGLCDVLSGDATLSDALIELEEHRLTILPAGQVPLRHTDLLGTAAMRRTLETLRTHFDRVIIDSPAVTPLADVSILTPLIDGLILVVRAGVTSKPAIREAIAALDRSKLIGLVLNESL